jgi:chromosome segregation ATPase
MKVPSKDELRDQIAKLEGKVKALRLSKGELRERIAKLETEVKTLQRERREPKVKLAKNRQIEIAMSEASKKPRRSAAQGNSNKPVPVVRRKRRPGSWKIAARKELLSRPSVVEEEAAEPDVIIYPERLATKHVRSMVVHSHD